MKRIIFPVHLKIHHAYSHNASHLMFQTQRSLDAHSSIPFEIHLTEQLISCIRPALQQKDSLIKRYSRVFLCQNKRDCHYDFVEYSLLFDRHH